MPKGPQGQKTIAIEAISDLAIRFGVLLAVGFPLEILFKWGLDRSLPMRPVLRDCVVFFIAFLIAAFAASAINRRLNAKRP